MAIIRCWGIPLRLVSCFKLLVYRRLSLRSTFGVVWKLAKLQREGVEVILVSSGAVAEGVARMELDERPKTLRSLQACAAIGQMGLIQAWFRARHQGGRATAPDQPWSDDQQ